MSFVINTVKGQIGIDTTRGSMEMQQPRGEQSISQTKAKMNIQSELPRVIIDQYECFAEAGLKNMRDLTAEYAQLGKQAAFEGIARRVDDGNRLATIGNNMPNAIPEIAKKNAWKPEREFGLATIPKSRPKIDVTGSLNIEWQLGGTDISFTPRQPIINYQPGKVDIYLKQRSSIDIRYVDERR